ncbi:MAG: hypothetical protein JW991_04370 [Candidatus Pacebacteria bacterium]|nr:hypothetical protein [Candidatus Paceibacterota bacterium]
MSGSLESYETRILEHQHSLMGAGLSFDEALRMAQEWAVRCYWLKTVREDVLEIFNGIGRRETQKAIEQVAFASLDLPDFGINLAPHHSFFEQLSDQGREAVCGQVYASTKKPYPADFVTSLSFEIDQSAFGPMMVNVLIVADGASSLVPATSWPQEVKDACRFQVGDKAFVRPDIYWRAGLAAILGDQSLPVPPEYLARRSVKDGGLVLDQLAQLDHRRSLEDRIKSNFGRQPMSKIAADCLLKDIDYPLGSFLRWSFDRFGEANFELYPSGVAAVVVHTISKRPVQGDFFYRREMEAFLRRNSGFALTGDITVAAGSYSHLRTKNDPGLVDFHDRELNAKFGQDRDNPAVLRRIARLRAPFCGNLQGRGAEKIQTGSLGPDNRFVFAYTDGLKPKPEPDFALGQGDNDLGAQRLKVNPGLAVLEKRWENWQAGRASGKLTADDGGWGASLSWFTKDYRANVMGSFFTGYGEAV